MNPDNPSLRPETTDTPPKGNIATAREKLTAARSSAQNDRLNEVIDSVLLLLDEAGV